jgi:hypothetical protein
MLMSKLKAIVAVVLVLGFLVTGATVLSCRTAAAQSDQPPIAEERPATRQKQEQKQEKIQTRSGGSCAAPECLHQTPIGQSVVARELITSADKRRKCTTVPRPHKCGHKCDGKFT